MTASAPSGRSAGVAQAVVVAASFAMLLAGSNALYPLLPIYRDELGLDPLLLSLTFTLYVAVLVLALFVLAKPRFTRYAAWLLLASLSLLIASDLLMAHPDATSVLLGRALGGLAGGLGTGAASALVVAAVGGRGRAVTATGNTVGAVLGATGSQLAVELFPADAPRMVFFGHAAGVAVVLIGAAVILRRRRAENDSALTAAPQGVVVRRVDRATLRLFATGIIAWTSVSVAVVFGATAFDDLHRPLVQSAGPLTLLCAMAALQLASPRAARFAPWASGALVMSVGVTGILLGAWLRFDVPAILGFAVLGAGIGIAYRAALVALTRGAAPAQQGALASLYAGVTYTAAATVVLVVGWIGNATGVVTATVATLAVLGALAIVSLAWTPRLRDTVRHVTVPA